MKLGRLFSLTVLSVMVVIGCQANATTDGAPRYRARIYSVQDLVSGTSYDPYRGNDLPTTIFQRQAGKEIELPVYEFTIRLVPSD